MNKLARIICLVLITTLVLPISAKEADNKLYFTSSGDRLYYDTKLFDENIFMYHDGMTPGITYTDNLLIENGSNTDYNLYLKIKEIEEDNDANILLDNISMEIYLDNELIYNGKVKGLDYNNIGVNIQEAAYIGKYPKNTKKSLVVKTKLNEDYLSNNKEITSHIEWEFFASYEDDKKVNDDNLTEVLPINPNTNDNIYKYILITLISLILIIILAIFKEKRNQKA